LFSQEIFDISSFTCFKSNSLTSSQTFVKKRQLSNFESSTSQIFTGGFQTSNFSKTHTINLSSGIFHNLVQASATELVSQNFSNDLEINFGVISEISDIILLKRTCFSGLNLLMKIASFSEFFTILNHHQTKGITHIHAKTFSYHSLFTLYSFEMYQDAFQRLIKLSSQLNKSTAEYEDQIITHGTLQTHVKEPISLPINAANQA
jgi:hypothetical protein